MKARSELGTGRGKAGLAGFVLACVIAVVAAAAFASPVGGEVMGTNEDQSVQDYVRAVEPICAKNTRQNARILKGVRRQVTRGQFPPAARKFNRATRAFSRTLKAVRNVTRPREHVRELGQWLALMSKQRNYLAQITTALRKRNGFLAQKLSLLLIRNAKQANQAVLSFDFRHCTLRPGKFM